MAYSISSNTEYYPVYIPQEDNDIQFPENNVKVQFQRKQKDNFDLATEIQNFGRKWIVPREDNLCETLKLLICTVHGFVLALFNSAWALSARCDDKTLNRECIETWKSTGIALCLVPITFIGIISPTASTKVEEFFREKILGERASVRNQNNIESDSEFEDT